MSQSPLGLSSRVRVLTVAVMAVLTCGGSAYAIPVGIDLGKAPRITAQFTSPFDALNGVSLNGQSLSLNFLFTKGEFVRLFSVTQAPFDVSITLQTNGLGLVGFLSGTGYLLDQHGNPIGSPQVLGSASGNDGTMSVGLFPLLSGQLPRPLDFFGVHFEWMLPTNPLVAITGGEFQLITAGLNHDDKFGIGPGVPTDIVPDGGDTLMLFALALGALLATRPR